MTGNRPFNNDSPQSVRRAVIDNDRRNARGLTFHDVAIGETTSIAGRFAAESKTRVTGSAPVQYPALPATSPWHDQQLPEPPVDYDISAAPIVGEPHEIAASLRDAGMNSTEPSTADSPISGDADAPPGTSISADASRSRRRSSKRRRR